MSEFLTALGDPDIPFLRRAFVVGLMASVAFGVMGSYVVVRRVSYIAGAIAHCVLGGIGAARYLQVVHGWQWFDPMLGATIVALGAALLIGWASLRARQREDTVIVALWSIGMAAGLLFLWETPGYNSDLLSYLFGNILLVSGADVWIVLVLDIVVVAVAWLFYYKLMAVCFDEEFARLRGLKVDLYYMLLLCLTAVTIVLMTRVVGILMVIALLTLPAATAGAWTRRMWTMMVLASGVCAFSTIAGLTISYPLEWPSGPVIIMVAGVLFLLTVLYRAGSAHGR